MALTILEGVDPIDLGLPGKFTEFRDIQRQMADWGVYGPEGCEAKRFHLMAAPVGSGKSLAAQALGKLSGMRYAILTATKTLEDQVVRDGFDTINVRGKSNYECLHRNLDYPEERWSCEEGHEHNCPHAGMKRCTYTGKVNEASEADSIISNYQFWMNTRSRNQAALEKAGPIGLLICDEAHKLPDELARCLGMWVSDADLHRYAGNKVIRELIGQSAGAEWGKLDAEWIDALETAHIRVITRMEDIVMEHGGNEAAANRQSKVYRALKKLADNLERVVGLGVDKNWLWRATRSGIAFDCVWPGRYAERFLWSGVPRVVLMSGTLRPKVATMSGLRPADYWFKEFPSVFLQSESPVYWVPTGRVGRSAEYDERLKSVSRLDEMADEWHNFKGIVHTASYTRAEWMKNNSKHHENIILSRPGEQNIAADEYRNTLAPVILMSPSFTTGWDFPEENMSWSLIPKLPFPDRSDPVVLARSESDDQWYNYETMQTLVQECGRQKRRKDQRTVTVITDDAIAKFRNYAKTHAPRHFRVMDAPGGRIPRAPR